MSDVVLQGIVLGSENCMNVAPITPKEAKRQYLTKVIPEEVYETVNEMLTERYRDSDAIIIYQDEVVSKAIEKMQMNGKNVSTEDFFTCHWLGFESLYIDAGWLVSREEPAYRETFKVHWIFKQKMSSHN